MRLLRWIGVLAIATATGASAGSVWSFFEAAAINRSDPWLIAIGWLAASAIAAGGLTCISDLITTSQSNEENTP